MKSISILLCACFLVVASILSTSSCKHDTDEMAQLPTISFNNQILPILNGKCGSCHGVGGSQKGIRFATYTDLMQSVSAGNPNSSKLYEAITSKWQIMPPSPNTPVSEEDRLKIFAWIKQGAPNN